ncbi:MAG: CHC2 zinc finger domain-containing protein [bacterium]|nr:CHC2 zinc finger domain-containing protein [bacterium]
MKQDFTLAKEELRQIGILKISTDFYTEPKRKGSAFFVRSPKTEDRTASLALYPNSGRFCDFANGGRSGDVIGFVAYIKDINQWEALKELQAFYGLANAREQDKREAQRRIRQQQENERKKRERQQVFYRALLGEIDRLKCWADIYRIAIEKRLYEPFDEMWTYCANELQKTEYKLDILCSVDSKTYPRLKPYADNLSSDRYQWLLDVLGVLQEQGAFMPTAEEMEEITAQRNFELTKRPGIERRCSIEW